MTSDIVESESQQKNDLYDKDYYLWVQETIKLLQHKKFNAIDLDNLIEEMEDMGRSEKKAVTSNLRILLMHLLKYQYQPEKRTNSWLFTIREHRKRLKEAFKTSPSLKNYYGEVFSECYQDARELATDETGLSIEIFPKTSPFSINNTLDTNYLPDNI
ncbi:DUF29 domain-containing protein [Crocosphaera sp. UHCC 0190]|uniref:DUF29 domain-containing protein n=1 Tax=Crocosphaera sp. UHCC 0190 TaxID=3110246 RepID=UPI002B218297|nr:DUF29 domain-containing protein [Crocosphaera sp. UHCC 0190]MEA5509359.1 DUF29 domain-containing protein [Crocosphaera sp. UHCC 0190]